MNKIKLHIIYSWVLLICFIAGQYMVYAHQHHLIKGQTKTAYSANGHQQPTVKEKCNLCDAMHYQAAIINNPFHFNSQLATTHFFKPSDYNFVNIGLVLAAGRAPPEVS